MRIRDFLKIAKGGITTLVALVAVTGFVSDPQAISKFILIIPLLISGILASFSASILNNIYDMDIDSTMKRTEYRNILLNNRTKNYFLSLAAGMLLASMFIAYFFINLLTALFIFLGFASYYFLYTIFLKRRTSWNIVIGGIAGSFPALAGWAAVSDNVSYTALFIAFLVFMWTPTHFWSLASYQEEDYKSAGVPMLPSLVGIEAGFRWIIVNTIILVAYSLIPLLITSIHVGIVYYIVALISDAYLIYRLAMISTSHYNKKQFRNAFIFSNFYLLLLLVSIWFVLI